MALSENKLRVQYERALERNAARLALLDALPEEDPYEDGQVLRISRTFNASKVYAYAVVRIKGEWWLSGRPYIRYGTDKYDRVQRQPISWFELREWLVDSGDPQRLKVEEMNVGHALV